MNFEEHLWATLAEEFGELAAECLQASQRIHKAMRFGLRETQPGFDIDNLERIRLECLDVDAMRVLLTRHGVDLGPKPGDAERIEAKIDRVLRLMNEISRPNGTLQP